MMNYFELFGLPIAPVVDKSVIAKKYFELQRKNHPDFYTRSNEAEQEESLDQSANINKAFNIFQDEQRTIEYFLQQAGLVIHDEKYNLPPDFLMEMMEINEALTEEDAGTAAQQVADYESQLLGEIKPILEHYNPGKTTREDLLKLKEYYYKKKYLNRILDRLDD